MSTAFLTSRMLSSEIRARKPPFYAEFGPNIIRAAGPTSRGDRGKGAPIADGERRGELEERFGAHGLHPPVAVLPDGFRQASAVRLEIVEGRLEQFSPVREEAAQDPVHGGNLAPGDDRVGAAAQREENGFHARAGMEPARARPPGRAELGGTVQDRP